MNDRDDILSNFGRTCPASMDSSASRTASARSSGDFKSSRRVSDMAWAVAISEGGGDESGGFEYIGEEVLFRLLHCEW